MSNQIANIKSIITPEVRDAVLANSVNLESAIDAAFKPFGFSFVKGQSLSKMVKESPQYIALDKKGQTEFFNKVKSTAKAHFLGEQLTLEAVVHGYWARFNGTLTDKKTGDLKQVNVSFMAPNVKASKLDDQMASDARQNALAAENARLLALCRTHDIDVEVTPVA
jgi:hypothetical protein